MSLRHSLARDIHDAGTFDPESLAEWLLRRGWTRPEVVIASLPPATETHWENGLPRLLTPDAYTALRQRRLSQDSRTEEADRG